ncbi:MAG: cofactor assembly of complex C subunit B [Acaryochloridaceae cyanobacterium CSU_3_4]|nr:cofactor assembly of complex C subunit B [Acaryochloridaceae cyanobacterium CSU_3_4]
MPSFVLPSTFLLTLLLMVGLFFFIRASVKDRTEESQWIFSQSQETILNQLETYLTKRAYRLTAVDKEHDQVTFEGLVRPSLGLACFLSGLLLTGTLCLSLVLSILLPRVGLGFIGLTLISPLAGWFYWQKAQRPEKVSLKVQALSNAASTTPPAQTLLTVIAHRDEIIAMRSTLKFLGASSVS